MVQKEKYSLTPLGKAIKKGIIDKNITQSELAEQVGTTVKYLHLILYGRRSGEKYIQKIGKILDIDVNKYVA